MEIFIELSRKMPGHVGTPGDPGSAVEVFTSFCLSTYSPIICSVAFFATHIPAIRFVTGNLRSIAALKVNKDSPFPEERSPLSPPITPFCDASTLLRNPQCTSHSHKTLADDHFPSRSVVDRHSRRQKKVRHSGRRSLVHYRHSREERGQNGVGKLDSHYADTVFFATLHRRRSDTTSTRYVHT